MPYKTFLSPALLTTLKDEYVSVDAEIRDLAKEMWNLVGEIQERLKAQSAMGELIRTIEPEFPLVEYRFQSAIMPMAIRPGTEPQPPARSSEQPAPGPASELPSTLDDLRFKDMGVSDIAEQIATEHGGLIPVQQLAEALAKTGRYKSMSSAYGAAHSHLSRNEDQFVKSGRGEFRVIEPKADEVISIDA